jgi:chromosome partitioning protein
MGATPVSSRNRRVSVRGHLDLELAGRSKPRRRLDQVLGPVADSYDTAFIEYPPGITLAIENVLRGTDVVLVPIVPSVLSLRSYDQLAAYLSADRKLRTWVLGFLSMVDRRKKGHRELCQRLPLERTGVMRQDIPASVLVENMPASRAPLIASHDHSTPSSPYRQLWDELQARLPSGRGHRVAFPGGRLLPNAACPVRPETRRDRRWREPPVR